MNTFNRLATDAPTTYHITELGNGKITRHNSQITCSVFPSPREHYHDAQITDYPTALRRYFLWRPPLRLTVQARFSHPETTLKGTAGFGFWNHPIARNMRGLPRIPQAMWFFFASPPTNMPLAYGVKGHGWKAAIMDVLTWRFFALLPFAPVGFLLMRIPILYQHLWKIGQRAIKVSECLLDIDMTQTHTYTLEWYPRKVRFWVDGQRIHETLYAPKGPLGFIAWIDNQYAVVTPQGHLGVGFTSIENEQHLFLDSIKITPLTAEDELP